MGKLMTLLCAAATIAVQAQGPATPPRATDLYLVPLEGGLDSMARSKPLPIATEAGYENQPNFTADGETVLFTANRDGKQTDAWAWDRATGRSRALWSTPESEYSPTLTPGGSYSVIRVEADGTQRLWAFDRDGKNPALLCPDIKPVGYQAWVDREHVGLFVLGKPSTLQLALVSTGRAQTVASDVGRSLHRVPGTRAVSFVERQSDGMHWLKQVDVDSGAIQPIVQLLPGSADRDVAWMPDAATLLQSVGTRIHAWERRGDKWRAVFDAASHGLGAITRIAVSPTADGIAIVVNEPGKP